MFGKTTNYKLAQHAKFAKEFEIQQSMISINITINYKEILKRIYTESGYIAQARSSIGLSSELSEMMSATEEEKRIFDNAFCSACKDLGALITRYISDCDIEFVKNSQNDEIEECVEAFTVPNNFPITIKAILKQSFEDFITFYMLQQWMLITKPDEANIYAIKLQGETIRIREMLASRKRPI